jgi:hypothetical protein
MDFGADVAPKAVNRPSQNLVAPRSRGDAATAPLAPQHSFALAISKRPDCREIAHDAGAEIQTLAQGLGDALSMRRD